MAALRESRLDVARQLRFGGMMWLATPERLVFSAGQALTLTDLRGRVVAQARWKRSVLDSGGTVSADGRHVVFRLTDAKRRHARVFVVSAGQVQARATYEHRLDYVGCGDGAFMSWHGAHALYRSTDAHIAVIDARSGRALDLTRLMRRLPREGSEQAQAWWASAFA